MKAIHINWTGPFRYRNPNKQYVVDDFELLTTIISALKWREHNGKIKLYTDKVGFEFYKNLNLTDLWDGGINISTLASIKEPINPNIFWAAGKIYAFRQESTPCIMMDTDFIVWNSINKKIINKEIVVIHREHLSHVYPHKEALVTSSDYKFDKKLCWKVRPSNTAFVYVQDATFKKNYTDEAIRFMTNNLDDSEDKIINMVFAEQRLFSMLAHKLNISIYELHDFDNNQNKNDKTFTHIWGYKDILRKSPDKRSAFCKKCIKRINSDYPDFGRKIMKINNLQQYF